MMWESLSFLTLTRSQMAELTSDLMGRRSAENPLKLKGDYPPDAK